MTDTATRTDVLVVGAGVSGLLAANTLAHAGRSVVVVDKGRSVGGRLATRRLGGGRADHGAQFFTIRKDRFRRLVDPLIAEGLVREWTRGWGDDPDGHPRYMVEGGMTALAKRLATRLPDDTTVHTNTKIQAVSADGLVTVDGGGAWRADHVIITSPVPQSIELLEAGGAPVPDALRRIRYDPTLVLLAVLDRPSDAFPASGAVYRSDPFGFITDNGRKGLSESPVLTCHLSEERSAVHWDDPDDDVHAMLLDLAAPWFGGATVVESQLKRWRYATPTVLHPAPCLRVDSLVFAGDAFGEARVEGAAMSGWAAADDLLAEGS